jgi:SAM-dependent methyltransferase
VDEAVYDQLFEIEERHWWFRGRRAVIGALLERGSAGAGGRFLDIGCGTGRNLAEFARGDTAVGVEFSEAAVELARGRGLDCRQGDAETLPFEDASFDVVSAFDVLEHLRDDRAALREARRVAAPGAVLVATVPAYQWLWSQHDETHNHYRRYTRPQLVAAAESVGWRTSFATYFNSVLLPAIALVRVFRRNSAAQSDYSLTDGNLDRLLALPMESEARLIARGLRLPAGVSVGAVFSAA